MTTFLALAAVLVLLAWGVFAFNRLVRLRNQWRTAWADIDVQLQRRHDLVPQLVAAGLVRVDGATESRKTAKIRAGQVVRMGDIEIRVR